MNTTLHNRIMRQVYFHYTKRLATHPIMMQLGLFVLALFVFAKLVHVRSVIDNLLSTNVASVPAFVLSAVMQGEVLTLMAVGVLVFTALSIPLQLKAQFMPRLRPV